MDITELKRQQSIKRHPWEIARLMVIKELIHQYSIISKHIVDIGGGDAYVIKSLCEQNIGSMFTAIDTAYSDDVVNQIKDEKCTINFLTDVPKKLNSPPDCVLLMDVLEHCEDDAALLQKAKNISTNETRFFITVPAYQQLFSQHDEMLYHYRRYSEKQLKTLCRQNGFIIIESGYFFFTLLLIRCIQLFLEKNSLRKPKKTIDNWNGSLILSKSMIAILKTDFFINRILSKVGLHLPGLSSFCICHPLP